MTPISRSPASGSRGLLVVFLNSESAALVQSEGPSLFIIESCDSSLIKQKKNQIKKEKYIPEISL